jgi:hypothetical protein
MRSNPTIFNKFDWLILLGIIGLTAAFFLPLLVGWGKFFYDDIAFVFYPQQIFLSRSLGEGVIPWWNPHLCAGATPFYAHIFQSSLSPLNWPFLFLGNLAPAHGFFWLIKAPLVLHYFLAAFFSYLFSRRGLRLNRPGSFIFALAYTFSPSMIYLSACPPEVFIQAWLPIFCLCLVEFFRQGRYGWIIIGAISFAIASPVGDVPVVSHVVFIVALFGTGLVLLAVFRRDWRRAIRVIGGGVLIFGIGALLAGVYWSNMIDGLRMIGMESGGIVEELSGPEQSLHPLYLITLFIPDFFGGVTSHHAWGAAFQIQLSLNDVNLLGGLVAVFLVVAGFFVTLGRARCKQYEFPSLRSLWWIFAGIFIFGILIVLGGYTPAHGIFRKIIPVLKLPYPVRFRSIECFAMAGLLGVSVNLIGRNPFGKRRWVVTGYLIGVLIFFGVALLWPYHGHKILFSPGFKHLTHLNDWSWFIKGPILYTIIAGIFLAGITFFRRGRYILPMLVLAVAAELFLFSFSAFYHNKILNFRYQDIYATRYNGPSDHPVYREIASWNPEADSEVGWYRRLYYRSYYDNLVWLNGALSILGFDIKPIDSRFQSILEELTTGFPYEIRVRQWDSKFWSNMSVRYALSRQPIKLPTFRERKKVGDNYTYELSPAVPRLYFQDRWIGTDEKEQREALLNSDLRGDGYCDRSVREILSLPAVNLDLSQTDRIEHFQRHQGLNRIINMTTSNPNRMEVEVEVREPSMLVITDIWHPDWRVTLDGEESSLHRVNYLQRGVWCLPGRYRIVMEFTPTSIRRGLIAGGVGIVAIVLIGYLLIRRKKTLLFPLKSE